ncbi:Edc3p [Saccharomyces cerevisiae YJM1419]|nr:Edc3p [Saccharomyces cerevisiae YJM1355]AJU48849.1 Edc3p [Saccharomyces cerevisiae YJM1381]AJU52410.1 Edc3p [Saccharomyces cerevisiae YJM1419]AJU52666.1 Edc3p [Saccharomyces cerevisiae YJM1433]AJV36581.1 Edc3p [Saccharomyces cerevisiae YJM541]AJV36835.1 Edc3p [Saccharomyces cerevisiae YJM554]CAI4407103.1 BDF_1d_G0014500.mRNA.1.CDS.1 [Saccharomyces cerevisiae]
MSQFVGFGVQVELKDGKLIQGKIAKATSKGLTLNDVQFGDGGKSQAFKVRASRLKDLKVLTVASQSGKRKQQRQQQQQNDYNQNRGEHIDWQDDDVSKIKQQEDFDFQRNLGMFNKKDVFAQLKQNDDILPENRLQGHNRRQTQLQQNNYQNDELVIPDAKKDSWNKISSRNEQSTHQSQPQQDAQDDLVLEDDEHEYDVDDIDDPKYLPITQSLNITHLIHSATNSPSINDKTKGTVINDKDQVLAKLGQMIISQSRSNSTSLPAANKQTTIRSKNTKQNIPMATPVQLLEMESITSEFFSINSAVLLENFAVNASFFLKQKLGGRARLRLQNSNPEPLVVILASDSNRSGAKALALGRHLCQTGHIRVITLFTCSQNELQDSMVKKQTDIYKKCGGKIVNSVSSLESAMETLNSPVEIVIDAMQGYDCTLSDLAGTSEVIETRIKSMISWCNKQRGSTKVWSLDIPNGFDAGSGMPDIFFSDRIEATGIICSGWPLIAINNLIANLPSLEDAVLIDIGIPQGAYSQRTSLRKFQNCDLFVTDGSLLLDL